MRILHACKHFYPRVTGVTAHVEHLAREQRASGHEVAVATWGEANQDSVAYGLPVLRARPGAREELMRLMESFCPDIIHAHSIWDVSHAAAQAARRLERPYVVTTHGTWNFLATTQTSSPWLERLRWGLWRRRVLWPRLLRGAGMVIALNALEETEALAAGVPAKRVLRIPNAVDVDVFYPADANEGERDRFTLLFVGAMEANKGILEVIQAASMLQTSLPQARWLLCGDGPDLWRAKQAAAETGAGETVVFLGRVDRTAMPELYRSADAVVAPSRMEAFSTALLEAMASGLPCVGTNVGGTPDIIDQHETGFLIPPGDPRALANTVRWLAEHPREARAMGHAGREKASRDFAWPLVAARIEKAYHLALALVLACLALCRPALAVGVYPLDILTMVDPRSGLAVDSSATNWQQANPVWDGSVIHLAAARGEAVGFQMVFVPDVGERLENIRIRVELPGLVPWKAYRAWHIWDVPEVAVPLAEGQTSFDIPAKSPAESAVTRDYHAFTSVVELFTPRGEIRGRLEGQVHITWNGGGATLPLVLAVLPLELPRRPAFELEMNSYGDYLRLLPASRQMFSAIHQLFRRFRCTFTLVPYRQDGSPLLDFLAPSLAADATPDFTGFDAALAGLFDGSAFKDGQPLSHWVLPLRANWPVPFGTDEPAYAGRNVRLRLAMARHIREKGWLATRFQEFHNENPEHGAKVPWRLDEPVSERDMAGHDLFLGFLDTARTAFGKDFPVHYRIDISSWQSLRDHLRQFTGKATDWSVSADPAFLDEHAVAFFRELGGQWLLAYGELPGFQTEGRATSWMRFPTLLAHFSDMGMDGYAQWQVDRWQDKSLDGLSPAAVPLFYSSAAGARDFMWPGLFFGQNEPLPSLRLFALREGLNLLDYLTLARQCRPERADDLRLDRSALADAGAFYAFKMMLAGLATGRCEP